jgi:hypothetical protein
MFCTKCGKQIEDDSRFCEYCGASFAANNSQPVQQPVQQYQNVQPQQGYGQEKTQPENSSAAKTYAIIGLIFSAIGLIVLPVLGVVGIICGSIGLAKTPKEENEWRKAIWKYQNKARGMSMLALMWGIIDVLWFVGKLLS